MPPRQICPFFPKLPQLFVSFILQLMVLVDFALFTPLLIFAFLLPPFLIWLLIMFTYITLKPFFISTINPFFSNFLQGPQSKLLFQDQIHRQILQSLILQLPLLIRQLLYFQVQKEQILVIQLCHREVPLPYLQSQLLIQLFCFI